MDSKLPLVRNEFVRSSGLNCTATGGRNLLHLSELAKEDKLVMMNRNTARNSCRLSAKSTPFRPTSAIPKQNEAPGVEAPKAKVGFFSLISMTRPESNQ